MKLSLRSEFALLSLIHLSRNKTSSAAETASTQEIPVEALAEILSVLGQAGYVNQVEGRIALSKDADQISVAEIIRLFDGALAPLEPISSKGYAIAPMDKEEKLIGLFEHIQQEIVEQLEGTSIARLA